MRFNIDYTELVLENRTLLLTHRVDFIHRSVEMGDFWLRFNIERGALVPT